MATTLYNKDGKPVVVADARRVAGMLEDGFTVEPVAVVVEVDFLVGKAPVKKSKKK